MGSSKGPDARYERSRDAKLRMIDRAKEVVEFLLECDGSTPLNANEFSGALAARYGRRWTKMDGSPNRDQLKQVKQMLHDQRQDPEVEAHFGGFMLDYAPTGGGLVLIGSMGEMRPDHLLHMLAGYLHQQTSISTILRRSTAQFRVASEQAHRAGDFPMSNVLAKIEDQIERQGVVDLSTIDEFRVLIAARGIEVSV